MPRILNLRREKQASDMTVSIWCSCLIRGCHSSRILSLILEQLADRQKPVRLINSAHVSLPPIQEFSSLTLNRLGLNKGSLQNAVQFRTKVKKEEELINRKLKQYFGSRLDERAGVSRPWM